MGKMETIPEVETDTKPSLKHQENHISLSLSNGQNENHCNNRRCHKRGITCSQHEAKPIRGDRLTRKLLKLQLISITIFLWFGVAIYGCDFPAKTVLNQILVFIYFFVIYAVGLTFGFYVIDAPSPCGMRIFMMLESVTIVSSSIFEMLSLRALSEQAEFDQNPLTRVWAANLYAVVILSNTLVLVSSLGLFSTGFVNSRILKKFPFGVQSKTENGRAKCPFKVEKSESANEEETTHCLNHGVAVGENGV